MKKLEKLINKLEKLINKFWKTKRVRDGQTVVILQDLLFTGVQNKKDLTAAGWVLRGELVWENLNKRVSLFHT